MKLTETLYGRLIKAECEHFWIDSYKDITGVIEIYESEHKYPGKKILYFYPLEPEWPCGRDFHTSPGDITVAEETLTIVTLHSTYTFSLMEKEIVKEELEKSVAGKG